MANVIKTFENGTTIKYDRGSFDEWCVYVCDGNSKKAPKDLDYFSDLKTYSEYYGGDKIYDDFVEIFNKTGKNVEESVLDRITEIASTYKEEDTMKIDLILSIIYLGMIAEENKKNTKLGKRIKRLGMYKLLKENESPKEAANFMRGMNWKEIDKLCKEIGF